MILIRANYHYTLMIIFYFLRKKNLNLFDNKNNFNIFIIKLLRDNKRELIYIIIFL